MAKKNKRQKAKKITYNTPEEITNRFNRITRNLDTRTCLEITKFVEEECNRYGLEVEKSCKKSFAEITDGLDRSFTAALIEKTDFSLEKIEKILHRSCDLISEDNKKIRKLKEEGQGDWMKAVDKCVEEINDIVVGLLDKGAKQKEIIQIVKDSFPKLSTTMVTNAYKKIKEMHSQNKQLKDIINTSSEDEKEIEDAVNYIFNDGKEEAPEKVECNKDCELDLDFEYPEEDKPSLEIINKKVILDVKGEFGVYRFEDNIIKIDDVQFESEDHVEEVYKKQIEALTMQKNEVLRVYELAKKTYVC